MTNGLQSISLAEAVRPLFVGIDLGGTNIKFGLVDDQGRSLARTSIRTQEERGPEDAVQRMARKVDQLLADLELQGEEIAAIGLATPGTMDIPAGLMLEPPNLPHWRNFPIRDRLSELTGRRVVFANDANAAAYGEYWVGRGREYHSMVLLTLGTGVGGGIIYGDVSIDGEHSHGSECGHIIIDYSPSARMCPCGQRGHLEAYCSALSLIKRAEEALEAGRESSVPARLEAGATLTPLLLAEEAASGDALSRELILETAALLGVGITSLMHVIDPGVVVLGGAMNFGGSNDPLGRAFLERVREEVRSRAFPVPAEKTVIDFAQLGGDAGYIGAAGIARARLRQREPS